MKLSVGRIIHVVRKFAGIKAYKLSSCWAAIVVAVDEDGDGTVKLFSPTKDSEDDGGHWKVLRSGENDQWHDPRECPKEKES